MVDVITRVDVSSSQESIQTLSYDVSICASLTNFWPLVQKIVQTWLFHRVIRPLKIRSRSPNSNPFIKVFQMMDLWQFCLNLTIGSVDRVQTRLFHRYLTW